LKLLHAILIFLLVIVSGVKAQGEFRTGWPGNNIVEFIQDRYDSVYFTDPIDDTLYFRRLDDQIYVRDNGKVFVRSKMEVEIGADTVVFVEYFRDVSAFLRLRGYKQLGEGFFQNKGAVYFWWGDSEGDFPIKVVSADPRTFKPFVGVGGGTDKRHVYYGGGPDDFSIVAGADPKTVKALNPDRGCWNCRNCYFVDQNHVYLGLQEIAGADPKTFRLVNGDTVDAEDMYGRYFDGCLVK
jgi:DKNYY family